MWGLISSIQRRLAPKPTAGFVFRVRAVSGLRSATFAARMTTYIADDLETGLEATIAVREADFEIAEEYVLGSARKMAPNSEFSIMSVRTADERDLPNGCQIYVREKRHFGFPQHKQHLMDH